LAPPPEKKAGTTFEESLPVIYTADRQKYLDYLNHVMETRLREPSIMPQYDHEADNVQVI
jgi:hypothetical protein